MIFDLLAWSSGLATGTSLDQWRLGTVQRFCGHLVEGDGRSIMA